MFDLWDAWSKQSTRYDLTDNIRKWNSATTKYDINYLGWMMKQDGVIVEPVQKYRPYKPITKDISNIAQITFNERYVSEGLDYDTFSNHDTIIIKSCTGTGKTTCVAKHAEQYMTNDTKFLSIVTRMSLADQHIKSFQSIHRHNYQDTQGSLCDVKSLVICLNSLHKLKVLSDDK